MFAMLNLRVTAALVAVQVFVLVVLLPGAPLLVGVAFGAAAAAATYYLGRAVLAQIAPAVQASTLAALERLLPLSSAAAFAVLLSFYFTLREGRAGFPWLGGAALAASLVALVLLSMRMNRVSAERT